MGAGGGDFKVRVSKREVVAAVLPLQEHWLPMSNLDLLLPSVDVGVFFCYRKPYGRDTLRFGSMVSVLKDALAQTLVCYYAFSAEIVPNSLGHPGLLCNNCGVDFLQAFADVELRDLNLYNPDQSIEGKLVPKREKGVLSIQVTELKCGGLVVACTFDHRMADAYSANMFLVAWSEIAQSKPLSTLPYFHRSLLNPRCPASYHPSIDDMYVPISTLPPPTPKQPQLAADHNQLVSRIYYVTADQLHHLQSMASISGTCKKTKLESFSAFLWKMVAKYAAVGENVYKNKKCKMGVVVDGRSRLSHGDDDHNAALMANYFGNVLSIPFGEQRIEKLNENPLSWVANCVNEYLKGAVTKEHFLGLIDWVAAHQPEQGLARMYSNGSDDGPAFVVSSGQRFPVSKVDFGWGSPSFGSYHFPWGGNAGYVMPMPSPASNGDWIIYMHLLEGQLEFIEAEAAHFFKPLTSQYLKLHD